MPVKVTVNGNEKLLNPTTEWSSTAANVENNTLEVDPNFYVANFNILK